MSRTAVIFGGPSPEHDISILTGLQAARALGDGVPGADPVGLYWAKTGEWYAVDPTLEAKDFATGVPPKAQRLDLVARPGGGFAYEAGRLGKAKPLELDVAVNCCHGGPGEDGTLQAALELAGVPVTGPHAAGAALGMDKLAFGAVVAAAGLPTLPRHLLTADGPPPEFAGPYIVKPRFGGSSIGIEVVGDLDTARALASSSPHLRDGALLEPWLDDATDLNVAVRTWPTVEVSLVERPLRAPDGRIYTYAEKYLAGGHGLTSAPRELPAAIDPLLTAEIERCARALVPVALLRGAPRVDLLLADGRLVVNEVNTIPGALGWYLWHATGVPFGTLLADLIDEARRGHKRVRTTDGADGRALLAAGTIAGKLA